jgi:hypothetical protein
MSMEYSKCDMIRKEVLFNSSIIYIDHVGAVIVV